MYKAYEQNHPEYGDVVLIEEVEEGEFEIPFFAMQKALTLRRLWKEKSGSKVRFLIDGQIMSIKDMENWSRQEYKSLPKCPECARIMHGDVFTHQLSSKLFCSQGCADRDYNERTEILKDEAENEVEFD